MLDTSLAHKRHFPAVNWFQSYSLYEKDLTGYFSREVSEQWEKMKERCREMLQREESLREVAEIVGSEGLQDADRLLMKVAEKIRMEFLCQNAYSEDAFSPPEKTLAKIREIIEYYDSSLAKLKAGVALDEILKG
jgi:V/A-type H+-transporting ATPase subunit A